MQNPLRATTSHLHLFRINMVDPEDAFSSADESKQSAIRLRRGSY
jgi:hypothetical protein